MRICSGCGSKYEEIASACPLCRKPYSAEEVPLETDSSGRLNLIMNRHSVQRIECVQKSEIRLNYAKCISGEEAGFAVMGCWDSSAESIIIPDSYMDKPILKIGKGAFKGKQMIRMVRLPSRLREIEDFAFENCTSLRIVSGGVGLIYIGEAAFRGCISLQEVEVLGKSDVGCSYSTFAGCYHLPQYPINK